VTARRLLFALIIGLIALAEVSCGGQTIDPKCITGIVVTPANSTADHLMPPPGNQQQFQAFAQTPPGCTTVQANLTSVNWSVSSIQDATISNAGDATFGTATCRNATSNPVTVTAMLTAGGQIFSASSALSCR
jgi:hypothetical protein